LGGNQGGARELKKIRKGKRRFWDIVEKVNEIGQKNGRRS